MTGPGEGSGALKSRPGSRVRLSDDAVPAVVKADFKRAKATLTASGYKASLEMKFDADCAAHSYGQVHKFFTLNPCKWLARAFVQVGNAEVLVAISWVEMPSAHLAEEYKRLVDTPDAGSVSELWRDKAPYRKIDHSTSPHTAGMSGVAVWNVQARPMVPKTTAEIAEIIIDSRQQ